jgi:hypothetical protein
MLQRAQGANWDTVRSLSHDLAVEVEAWTEDVVSTYIIGNGFAIVFADGSEVTYSPAITKNRE